MTREQLIEFANFLDEGCDLLGKGYIESKTDEWLQKVANKNFALADVSGRSEQLSNSCECDNVETFNGWGNEKCIRCIDCGRVW